MSGVYLHIKSSNCTAFLLYVFEILAIHAQALLARFWLSSCSSSGDLLLEVYVLEHINILLFSLAFSVCGDLLYIIKLYHIFAYACFILVLPGN